MMRRRLALITSVVAAGAGAAGLSSCGSGGSGYEVRAMFSNAFTVIPGEDVKVAGVPIGQIKSLDVEKGKAAVVLEITDKNFQDFRKDASCTIRPQALIGERYVECTLTQPREPGKPLPPELAKIKTGPNKGQRLLPVSQTVNPIDMDLVVSTYSLPYRERLSIIINELGVGLAGNGEALRQAVRSANPALRETDKFLKILADQDRALATIASEGDRALQPLAAQRERLAHAIGSMNTTARATADERDALEATLQRMPAALRELRPTMQRLQALTEEGGPIVDDLSRSADDINRIVLGLGDFADAGIPATRELGKTAVVGRKALLASKPILQDARAFAKDAKPLFSNASALLSSLAETGGVERLMDFLYFNALSVNGFDEDGHYLRAAPLINVCQAYSISAGTCTANFVEDPAAGAAEAKAAAKQDEGEVVGRNYDGTPVEPAGKTTPAERRSREQQSPLRLPQSLFPGDVASAPKAESRGAATASRLSRPDAGGSGSTQDDGATAVLDYLMGG